MAEGSSDSIRFSAGADKTSLTTALQELLSSAGRGGRWTLTATGQGLERSFRFKNFAKTWVYNTTYIRWTTHSPEGLSAKDVQLASLCDSLARDFGEVVVVIDNDNQGGGGGGGGGVDVGEAQTSSLRRAADRVVRDSGDCCGPKKG